MTEESDETERRLAVAARAGDRAAFGQLVGLQKAPLYRFVRRYVGDSDDAYDIIQEAFIAAWLALPRFDTRQSFPFWLRAIALNKCRDYGRRRAVRQRLRRLFALEFAVTHPSHPDPTADAPGDAAQGEAGRLLRLDQAIANLPQHYKEPLLLTLTAGLTQEQAAEQLGITTKAVEMRIRRAKRRLGAVLSESSQAWPDPER